MQEDTTSTVTIPKCPWQNIETAPYDGERILVYKLGCGYMVAFSTHNERSFRIDSQEQEALGWTPTHWMPLPKEPEL